MPAVLRDLEFTDPIARGARGARARLVQEWLSLHGLSVAVDGSFGPATESAVRAFQRRQGLGDRGVVNRRTFEALVAPIRRAMAPIVPRRGATLGQMTVAYARQHLAEHPREVGGANAGPWVRLYMDGQQGAEWAWCAGFVTWVLRQAADTLGTEPPVRRTFSCDELAGGAGSCFCRGTSGRARAELTPGSIFLVRRTAGDWTHTGFVLQAEREVFQTIEGNTNDGGSREGLVVLQRTSGYSNKDFVLIA